MKEIQVFIRKVSLGPENVKLAATNMPRVQLHRDFFLN